MATRFDDWEGDFLEHNGIRGMKWGVRRYQNEDGSLTSAGRQHYGVGDAESKKVSNHNVHDNKGKNKKVSDRNVHDNKGKNKKRERHIVKKAIAAAWAYNKVKKSKSSTKGQKAIKAMFLYGIGKRILRAK